MTAFRHPAFAKLSPKLDRAAKELGEVERFFEAHREEVLASDWGALSAISLGIHNVYNGIEDVLMNLAKDVDGLAPSGPTIHQDLLDQMSAEIAGVRAAVLDPALHEALTELKGFRHLVRHRYGFDLKAIKVAENLARMRAIFPAFVAAVVSLEGSLVEEIRDEGPEGR